MLPFVLAILLGWDQPYPPEGAVPADGVRCYVSISAGAWASYEDAPVGGPCRPDAVILAAPLEAVDFMVRGYNTAGESRDSNVWRLCAFEVREEAPWAMPGIQVWSWRDALGTEYADHSELVTCVTGAP